MVKFTVQLEINIKGEWKPIVRYDTAHGFAHRDIFRRDGGFEKTPLAFSDYSSALTFAEMDLRSNWKWYQEQFLGEEYENE